MTTEQLQRANSLFDAVQKKQQQVRYIEKQDTIDSVYISGQYIKPSAQLCKVIHQLIKAEATAEQQEAEERLADL